MDSKILSTLIAVCLSALVGCQGPAPSTAPDEDIIGTPIDKVSTLSKQDGNDSEKAFVFDETTRKIHQFELSTMTYQKSFQVRFPDRKHVVLSHDQGNYVIDLCEKMVTIYSKTGLINEDPISFQGQPISAAFRSDLNLLVMYDDVNSVGFVQIDNNGNVIKAWTGGSLVGGASIQAGDLLNDGRLILSLSDRSIAIVDVVQTLAQSTWVFTTFNSGLSENISWIAPMKDNANHIFVKTKTELAIYNINTHAKVTSVVPNTNISKLSKLVDAHVVTTSAGGTHTLYYAQAGQIHQRSVNNQDGIIFVSYLNLAKDNWKFIDTKYVYDYFWYNDADFKKSDRTLKSFRLSDMLAEKKTLIEDRSQAMISNSFVFHLFPSELGYATRVNIKTGEKKEAKFFNVGHIGD